MVDAKNTKTLEDSLTQLSKTLGGCTSHQSGDIVLHLSGDEGGEYCISCLPGKEATIAKKLHGSADRKPLFEVWGDANVIRAILDGEKDAMKQFLGGKNMRIRGNLRRFSDIAVELGILKNPL